jgi:hypothetical protein
VVTFAVADHARWGRAVTFVAGMLVGSRQFVVTSPWSSAFDGLSRHAVTFDSRPRPRDVRQARGPSRGRQPWSRPARDCLIAAVVREPWARFAGVEPAAQRRELIRLSTRRVAIIQGPSFCWLFPRWHAVARLEPARCVLTRPD